MASSLVLRAGTPSSHRLIGRVRAAEPGPTFIAIGSIHGNEPAGHVALAEVVATLEREPLLKRGELLALIGNVAAVEAGKRYIEEDLNRRWHPDRLERLTAAGARSAEDRERLALLEAIQGGIAEARGPVVLLDLHTVSGEGKPFAVFADTLRSRSFARRFPVPAVLGLEEQLEATLVDYVGLLGHVAVGFEGGQHEDPASVARLAGLVWLALEELHMLDPARSRFVREERKRLTATTEGIPAILEVVYRHAITEADRFRMHPGFRSFQPVSPGEIVAEDARGEVVVPERGYLLMPLYQKQGDDGFFVAREVWAFWLALSSVLRYLRVGYVAHWLPGVARAKGEWRVLRVNRRVARLWTLQVLHLLGYRKRSEEGDVLVVERRQHDLP